MPRLPIVGGDDDQWGDILNDFLDVSLDTDHVTEGERGKLRPSAVDAAGAVMNSDASVADMSFVIDEDDMVSNSDTKVPTQQSVKSYIEAVGTYIVSNAVFTAGDQTIGGEKTFTSETTVQNLLTVENLLTISPTTTGSALQIDSSNSGNTSRLVEFNNGGTNNALRVSHYGALADWTRAVEISIDTPMTSEGSNGLFVVSNAEHPADAGDNHALFKVVNSNADSENVAASVLQAGSGPALHLSHQSAPTGGKALQVWGSLELGSGTASFSPPDNTLRGITLQKNYVDVAATGGTYAYSGLESGISYGTDSVNARGTAHAITSFIEVAGSNTATSEVTPLLTSIRVKANQRGRFWVQDAGILGPTSGRPDAMFGITMFMNNYYNGSPNDAPSHGFAAVARPGSGPATASPWTGTATYPNDIGYFVGGYASSSRNAWNYGIQVGGRASGWMGAAETSRIGTGIRVLDYTTAGMIIEGAKTGATTAIPMTIRKNDSTTVNILEIQNEAGSTTLAAIRNDGSVVTPTLYGGTGSGDNLVLESTSHATKGVIVLNESGSDTDIRMESTSNTNMLLLDAGNNRVMIGGTTPGTGASNTRFSVSSSGQSFTSTGGNTLVDFRATPAVTTTGGTNNGSFTTLDATALPEPTVNMGTITGVSMQAAAGGSGTSTVTEAVGVQAFATSAGINITTTTASSVKAQVGGYIGAVSQAYGVNVVNTQLFGTTTNVTGINVGALPGSTSKIGVDIAALSGATTNIGVRIAKGNTYTLQLSDTDGTPASGITFGTDTNLYRSAADTLRTDDKLLVSGEIELDGDLNHDGSNIGFFGATPAARSTGWSVSNGATVKSYDANATTMNEMADVLGTLIEYLKTIGILGA